MALFTCDVAEVALVLRRGGIAVYPTETFYGLGAVASLPDAIARLARAKFRPEGKPLPLVVADRDMAFALWSAVPDEARVLAAAFWPGPLTLVSRAANGLPAEVAGPGTVGVRVPGSEVARDLSRLSDAPLVSTSANLSGGEPVRRVEDLDPALALAVDAVLDGGPTPGGLPSTVVEVGPGRVVLVRGGAVPWPEILRAMRAAALPSAAD
ncbi:MAG TPA: L-threonylcarbamoyladenylate synthase [Anaeromyxobacteraceae bacterium]|nr:L-threonylcarbamoyladenylate synthase [Anaeromyxobacteraceae bacterium]